MTDSTDAIAARPGIAGRLSRLIQLDTVSSRIAEHGSAEFEELLEELYPLVHRHLRKEKIGERGLLFTWGAGSDDGFETRPAGASQPSEATDAGPVVLMAHFDTVPTGDPAAWTHAPLSGAVESGAVHGRGAIDDKGALVVLFDAVENLLAAGVTPRRTVLLSLGGDEETYGTAAATISEELHTRGIRPWLVLDEGGAVIDGVLPGLPYRSAVVGLGEKGVLSVRLTASAPPGHASTPSRSATAPVRIARALARLARNPFPKRLNATSRKMFEAYRGVARGSGRALVELVPLLGPVSAQVLGRLGGEPAAMVQTTVTPTMLSGGTAHNVIPETASAVLNLRIALGETVDGTLARLRRVIRDASIEFEVLEGHDPSPESRTDNAQWGLIEDAVSAAYPGTLTVPYVMLAASDARHFHRHTPDATYRLAPLAMSSDERAALHGVNERVTADALERGEVFYRRLIGSLPAPSSPAPSQAE